MRKKGTKAMGNNGIELERDGFKSRTGFILACIGSAVGMGNIWRFPYMVSAWGGMTFLIPYVLFVILIGSTYPAAHGGYPHPALHGAEKIQGKNELRRQVGSAVCGISGRG